MPNAREDFWPDDITTGLVETPVAMLRTQASLLGEKTQQRLTATVVSVQVTSSGPPQFVWSFQISMPALAGYRYELFRVIHSMMLYPVSIIWENHPTVHLETSDEFREYLRGILQSDQTKQIVRALLAQVTT